MDLHLTVSSQEAVRIHINGRLAAEVCVQQLTSHADLTAEVRRARRLEYLPRMLAGFVADLRRCGDVASEGLSVAAKVEEWRAGLLAGLDLRRYSYVHTGTPGLPQDVAPDECVPILRGKSTPEDGSFSAAFRRGYEAGKHLRRVNDAFTEAAGRTEK